MGKKFTGRFFDDALRANAVLHRDLNLNNRPSITRTQMEVNAYSGRITEYDRAFGIYLSHFNTEDF